MRYLAMALLMQLTACGANQGSNTRSSVTPAAPAAPAVAAKPDVHPMKHVVAAMIRQQPAPDAPPGWVYEATKPGGTTWQPFSKIRCRR